MNSLNNLLLQLENHIPNFEKTNSKISNSTIGWQIDHCLLVINGVMSQIEISNPTEFQSKFNFNRFMVFTTGKIPRGKIRAPKVVTPFDVATAEELKSKIKKCKIDWDLIPLELVVSDERWRALQKSLNQIK